ncbi:MAG: putative acyl-CoA dehydrogenase [Mycobacterium sp.]|nr:putative acyl-CoA dehydrogenase [Mycobacterium sp.]
MNFRYDDEQEELRRTVRRFLQAQSPEAVVRRDMQSEGGWDPALHARVCKDLGLVGLAVPEEYGGAGAGLLELGVVMQEAGRSLVCAPLLSSCIAARALLDSGDAEACKRLLPDAVEGETLITLAAQEGAGWNPPPATLAAESIAGWTLNGAKEWVLDAASADVLLVSAATGRGVSLFAVERTAPGVTVEPLDGIDPTRRQARVRLHDARGRLIGEADEAGPKLDRTLRAAVLLLAAEQTGVAELCLEMATAYALQRRQFGRQIGSFQAIKHKLASVLMEVEAASAAIMYGLWAADGDAEDLPLVTHIAAATCSEAALLAAGENIQVHGGMGATWEHPAHLYLKRATTSRMLFGDPQHHREALAVKMGLAA